MLLECKESFLERYSAVMETSSCNIKFIMSTDKKVAYLVPKGSEDSARRTVKQNKYHLNYFNVKKRFLHLLRHQLLHGITGDSLNTPNCSKAIVIFTNHYQHHFNFVLFLFY